jgi:catechol 2,3-dioxygenase-like lactoylglutathione lyase family enzyme
MTEARKTENKEFELRGINHLALVCRDMATTVDFYCNTLGMPLTKTIDFAGGRGQHFFFDIGNGDSLAFFWFREAPEAAPGIAAPEVGKGISAHGSMNHVAFDVSPEKIEEYREKLLARGIEVTEVVNHDDTPRGASRAINETTFVRSIYFRDPDGISLEFAAWARDLTPEDATKEPIRVD